MADSVFGSIPFVGNLGGYNWGLIALATLVVVFICGCGLLFFFYMAYRKKTKAIIEIDQISQRIKTFRAKIKKDMRTHAEKLYIGKYRKNIDKPQQRDIFYKKNDENIILIKDLNGLHHPLRIMSYDELCNYYKLLGIDISSEYVKQVNEKGEEVEVENPYFKYHEVYAMPNPSESLDWLGKECIEAAEEFKEEKEWWQHPYFAYVTTGFICFLMIVVTLIFRGKI